MLQSSTSVSPLFNYLAPSQSADEKMVCLTGIEPVSDYPRKVVHRRGNSTGRLVVGNCAPDCALTGVYPRQTPSLTGRHGERPPGGQVVETTAENVIRYVSTLLQRSAFQACLIDRSSISPSLESSTYGNRDRTENELCSNSVGVYAHFNAYGTAPLSVVREPASQAGPHEASEQLAYGVACPTR